VPDQVGRIDELLAVARDADAGLAEVRQGATYAGDPDPYKREHDDLDETDDSGAVTGVDSAPRAGQSSDS
jgi:ribosome-binding factor A